VLTLLAPAIMTVVMILPAKLATMGEKTQHIVVVTSTPQFGEMVREQLSSADAEDERHARLRRACRQTKSSQAIRHRRRPNPTEAERAVLRDKVDSKAIEAIFG